MKKILTTVLLSLIMVMPLGITAFAETTSEKADVYVTISDDKGKLVMASEKISVSDTDGDGKLTINDALYTAHEEKYEGGAAKGYASYVGQYGLAINKLWGVENGGSYGYYLNNKSTANLSEKVNDGDCVNAYCYTDLTAWSDTYCYFDVNSAETESGKAFSVTLSAAAFDSSFKPITVKVEGAEITVNGEKIGVKTDKDGKAEFTIEKSGEYIISAVSDSQTLVPPALKLKINGKPGSAVFVLIAIFAAALILAFGVFAFSRKRKTNEK